MVRMRIPQTPDGENDWEIIAQTILQVALKESSGSPLFMAGNVDGEQGQFRALHDGNGGVSIYPESIKTKFGASLYMALESLAPDRVALWEAASPSQIN